MKNNTVSWLPPFILGFMALVFQIIFMREFSVHFSGNEITLGILLASWLLWGGFGSLLAPRFGFRQERFLLVYFLIILFFPICLIGLRLSRFLLGTLPGEITGMLTMVIFSLVLSSFISFPLGVLFVQNTLFLNGNLSRVYLFESLGSTASGILVYFVFIPRLSNWQTAALLGGLISLLIFLTLIPRKKIYWLLGTLTLLFIFACLDLPTQKLFWKPFPLVESKDSHYGKIQVLKHNEQISLYNNGIKVYSYPDLEASEESIHFSLLQNPEAKKALLIGGGVGGNLKQLLKYPQLQVDYVELDPEITRLSLQHLPEEEKQHYQNPRVKIIFKDGRAFLKSSDKIYDIILLNLPDPASAQINRFYTHEFFLLASAKLSEQGVFSFRVTSAENYISLALQDFLASLHITLKDIFQHVAIVPGATNIFLASPRPLDLDPERLSQIIEDQQLQNRFLIRPYLHTRLDPLRQQFLMEKIQTGSAVRNSDLKPISYFFNSVLWSTQFKSLETRILSFLSQAGPFWLLDFPLILFLITLTFFTLKKRKNSYFLVPLSVMGLTTIVFEIIVIIGFQTMKGYLYHSLAILLAAFMLGLSAGALRGIKRKTIRFPQLLPIQFGFVLLILFLDIVLKQHMPPFIFFLLLLLLGFLGGDLFIISNTLFLKSRTNYGIGYAFDLFGSFLGAICASSILIPLFGLEALLKYLLLLNSFCFLYLVSGLKKNL